MNNKDFTLLTKIKSGDKLSYKILFEKYYSDLARFANFYVKDKDTAEELTQEFFVQFWIKKNDINISSSVKSYFYSSIRNRALNQIRNKKNEPTTNIELEDQNNLSILSDESNFDYELIKKEFASAIESLPQKCKTTFLLSREENLTYKQISEKLNVSPKTVENQMGIALKKLREKLKPLLEDLLVATLFFFLKIF